MAINKTTSSDYTISVGPYTGGAWTGTMTINGNLAIVGNVTYVSDLAVNDAFIIVAANNTGTVTSMGMVAQKTSSSWAGLRYNSVTNEWEVSNNVYANGAPIGNSYVGITGVTAAGNTTEVQYNNGGTFAANSTFTFNYTTNTLQLQGPQVLGNIGTTPTATANSVTIYNNAPGSGATGLYVVGNTIQTDEVISLTRARLYSIIF